MRLSLTAIRKQRGRALPWSYKGPVPAGFGMEASPGDRLEVELKASASGDKILLQGTMRIMLTVPCSRCLKPFRQKLQTDFNESFVVRPGEDRGKDAYVPAGEDTGELVLSRDYLYPEEYLRQLFLLTQDLKPLCRVDCPGICPRCGGDHAGEGCCCKADLAGDPRLGKLKDLLSRNSSGEERRR